MPRRTPPDYRPPADAPLDALPLFGGEVYSLAAAREVPGVKTNSGRLVAPAVPERAVRREKIEAPAGVEFQGPVYDPLTDYERLNQQTKDVWDALVMDVDAWWTLHGLQQRIKVLTDRYHSEPGISARLRDFRKPSRGRWDVQRRGAGVRGLYEYRLNPDHYRARLAAKRAAEAR